MLHDEPSFVLPKGAGATVFILKNSSREKSPPAPEMATNESHTECGREDHLPPPTRHPQTWSSERAHLTSFLVPFTRDLSDYLDV